MKLKVQNTIRIVLAVCLFVISGAASAADLTGQDDYKFKVLYTRDHLPQEAQGVLVKAHGGFAVDRRSGKGETYFALPGAGIIQISADLKSTKMIPTANEVKNANMHNTTIWYDTEGTPFLSFPGNDVASVFTTTLDGKLVHTLSTPAKDFNFDEKKVNNYFSRGEKFVPTDVEYLNGLLYVTTGYSALDYVLTAYVAGTQPLNASWYDLAFGGKGEKPGQFGTGHGITVSPDQRRLHISDRPNSEIESFTRFGHLRDTLSLPKGSFPCDTDFAGGYQLVGCLHGPDRDKGAPIYLLKDGELLSTIMPKEDLGLEKFQHIHNAQLRIVNGKLYVIAQAWNPGDFAILEHVE